MAQNIGFLFPFAPSTGSLGLFEVSRDEITAIRSNLRVLLITNWGERVGTYHFGCNLREFLFENHSSKSELKGRIADRILNQVQTWMPFMSIDTLNIIFPDEDLSVPQNGFKIHIQFSINSRPDLSAVFTTNITP